MTKFQKFLDRLFRKPPPRDIRYDEAARYLKTIGCKVVKGTGSHRVFTHPKFPEYPIVLVEDRKCVRRYQIDSMVHLADLLELRKGE
ncbi:type II toxin-antitoxin system HicA family toxin [Bacillus spizizenii]|nr:type II toxin-antitoxin system HicA family toxin [Bacillus spizizenii]